MPHPSVVVAAVVAVVGLGAGVFVLVHDPGPSASRRATDRRCERAYVTPTIHTLEGPDRVRAEVVLSATAPSALAIHPDGTVLLGERHGLVRVVRDDRVGSTPVLDLRDDTYDDGDGGLLALTFDPRGEWLYVYRTDRRRDDVVTAYPAPAGIPDATGERVILALDHPASDQHHGGGLAFGPDGALYIGTGDGGGLGDPRGNGQRLSTLFGKVLRILATPDEEQPYEVPPDNPFVDRDGARPEVYLFGVRNPFKIAFDLPTGDLWIGDVGQSCWEEIDVLRAGRPPGANLGWDRREGSHAFEGGQLEGTVVDPVHSYAHRGGNCAVVLGPVYRGERLRALQGFVLYTDYCRGRLYALRAAPGAPVQVVDLELRISQPVGIAVGPDGEPWVMSLDGSVYRLMLTLDD